jgi:quinol monooxygenase YgiN
VFIISGHMKFDPARREECHERMRTVAAASVTEDGCIAYGYAEDVSEPGSFRIFEHWASDEAFGAHCTSDAYNAFMAWIGEIGMLGADVNRYEVSSVQSLTGG